MQPFKQFTMLTENETSTSENTGSGLRWVKASERLPTHNNIVHILIDGITKRTGNFYFDGEKYGCGVSHYNWNITEDKFNGVEWLEEYNIESDDADAKEELFEKIMWCQDWLIPHGEEKQVRHNVASIIGGYKINFHNATHNPQPDYHTHLSNLIKIIGSLGAEHGHSLNPEFKKQFEDAKKLLS